MGIAIVRPHKRFVPASSLEGTEAPGQLGGAEDLDDDIALCSLQTINEAFLRYLPKPGLILEAGAGRGRWVFHLRRLGYDCRGLELAASEVAFSKAFDPDVPIMTGDILRIPLEDASCSAVISLGVLEHFEEGPQKALDEVKRILEGKGLLLVTVPTRNLFRMLVIDRIKDLQTWMRRASGTKLSFEEYRYTRHQFSQLLRQEGFEIVEMLPDDFAPPKNMGLYTDSRLFQSRSRRWELNAAGRSIRFLLDLFSPWLSCSGTLWVCRVGSRGGEAT